MERVNDNDDIMEILTGKKGTSDSSNDFNEKVKRLKEYYGDLVTCLNEIRSSSTTFLENP